jgi:hypothetical protein
MRKLLSGLALVALVAGAAQAKPDGGSGGGHGKGGQAGGNPHATMGGGGPGKGNNGGGQGKGGPVQMRQVQAVAPPGGHGNARGGGKARAEQAMRGGGQEHATRAMHQQNRETRTAARLQSKSDRQVERADQKIDRRNERAVLRANNAANNLRAVDNAVASARFSGRGRGLVAGCPPGLAKKNNGCMPPGLAARSGINAASALTAAAGTSLLASSLTPSWFGYNDYGPGYRYYDGYLLRTNGDSVLGYVPLLGGALAPGRPWLTSFEPAPIPAYWTNYYDLGPVERYRYYDDVLYQLDPGRSEIEVIVALMAGDPWAVGEPMPYGYDVYNVPYGYRTRYYDGPEHWYRYSDGYVYDIDPTTRLVSAIIQLLA